MICCYLEEDQCIQKRTAHKLLIKIAQHICNMFFVSMLYWLDCNTFPKKCAIHFDTWYRKVVSWGMFERGFMYFSFYMWVVFQYLFLFYSKLGENTSIDGFLSFYNIVCYQVCYFLLWLPILPQYFSVYITRGCNLISLRCIFIKNIEM